MNRPVISVVLAAYNCGDQIEKTLQSVINQEGPCFEFIVVNDGSTDSTASAIESALTSTPRTTVISNQRNEGLTRSLILGCGRAAGKYIARIDAGDRYLPGRLLKQYELLEQQSSLGMVSCGTRFISAEGERLYEVCQQPGQLADGLSRCEINSVQGPSHHGSTMFRRDIYESVGGYRAAFPVAQDLDLWLRMIEVSEVQAMPEVLYESTILPGAISVRGRKRQFKTARIILEGARLRRKGEPEPPFDTLLDGSSADRSITPRRANARYEYFVAGCLADHDSNSALRHYRKAWQHVPWNLRYALKYWKARLL